MDLDTFFVTVECRLHPELKGKPLIVGGSNGKGVLTFGHADALSP